MSLDSANVHVLVYPVYLFIYLFCIYYVSNIVLKKNVPFPNQLCFLQDTSSVKKALKAETVVLQRLFFFCLFVFLLGGYQPDLYEVWNTDEEFR